MKKLVALFLLSVLSLSLVACGDDIISAFNDYAVSSETVVVENEDVSTDVDDIESSEVTPIETSVASENTEVVVDDGLQNGMRPEFKEAMDNYEAFYDEYCAFMKKYNENPTDMGLLTEYLGMVERLGEMDEAFRVWDDGTLNNVELEYYLEVTNRVLQKMTDLL